MSVEGRRLLSENILCLDVSVNGHGAVEAFYNKIALLQLNLVPGHGK